MSDRPIAPAQQANLARPATRRRIDLDYQSGPIDERTDLINCTIVGTARSEHELNRHNFISCIFENAAFRDLDISGCDFKDTLVVDCEFSRCRINSATHTASIYKASTFNHCNFHNAAITDCEYYNVDFIDCDLDNVLIKNSRLYTSRFISCATSTHVFENCIFVKTEFERSEIELRMLVSNFGLKASFMIDNRVRDNRRSQLRAYIAEDEVVSTALKDRSDPLALLAMQYFSDGHLLGAADGLDAAFDLRAWARMARQPASFAQLIELFAEFLVTAYENNEVDMHKILLLHDVTGRIAYDRSSDAISHRYAVSFGGIYLALSRLVEDYLDVLDASWNSDRNDLWVVAEGPLSRAYHQERLAPFLEHCGVRLGEIRPYNSVLLQLLEDTNGGRLFALAIILASFVRVELKAVRAPKRLLPVAPEKSEPAGTEVIVAQEPMEFFHFASGMTGGKRRTYELRVKSLVPTTSIVVDLKLAVPTGFVRKIRQCIARIADDN
jgi:uncharacterized protein YjbI with pentapeptide repeats